MSFKDSHFIKRRFQVNGYFLLKINPVIRKTIPNNMKIGPINSRGVCNTQGLDKFPPRTAVMTKIIPTHIYNEILRISPSARSANMR